MTSNYIILDNRLVVTGNVTSPISDREKIIAITIPLGMISFILFLTLIFCMCRRYRRRTYLLV